MFIFCFFFFQAEDGIRDVAVTGVQTCALPIFPIRKDPAAGHSAPAEGSITSRTAHPATRLAPPIAAVSRYDVRIISRPAANEANIQLTEAVPTTNPATPGLLPMTPCT